MWKDTPCFGIHHLEEDQKQTEDCQDCVTFSSCGVMLDFSHDYTKSAAHSHNEKKFACSKCACFNFKAIFSITR